MLPIQGFALLFALLYSTVLPFNLQRHFLTQVGVKFVRLILTAFLNSHIFLGSSRVYCNERNGFLNPVVLEGFCYQVT